MPLKEFGDSLCPVKKSNLFAFKTHCLRSPNSRSISHSILAHFCSQQSFISILNNRLRLHLYCHIAQEILLRLQSSTHVPFNPSNPRIKHLAVVKLLDTCRFPSAHVTINSRRVKITTPQLPLKSTFTFKAAFLHITIAKAGAGNIALLQLERKPIS
jgi:hypothetical protein